MTLGVLIYRNVLNAPRSASYASLARACAKTSTSASVVKGARGKNSCHFGQSQTWSKLMSTASWAQRSRETAHVKSLQAQAQLKSKSPSNTSSAGGLHVGMLCLRTQTPWWSLSQLRSISNNMIIDGRTYTNADFRRRLKYGIAIFGGTLIGVNLLFNQGSTNQDNLWSSSSGGNLSTATSDAVSILSTSLPSYERKYLNSTFLHLGIGVGMIAVAARMLHRTGWSYRLMAANPWMVMGVGLVGSIGTMYGTLYTSPENRIQKYGLWSAFNLTQAALMSPLLFVNPAILARAGLYAAGMMGSIAFVGATAKQDQYLYLGGPLVAGVAVVALSGLAPFVLPATAARSLAFTQNVWLYGGLAVFGGFTLYDVQKVRMHARLIEQRLRKADPVNEAVHLEMDFINIFVRLVQILGMTGSGGSQRRR